MPFTLQGATSRTFASKDQNLPSSNRALRSFSVRRFWRLLPIAVLLLAGGTCTHADSAIEPAQPDPVGGFQLNSTPASVPNYTRPDPDKAITKDLANADDAVAQSASRS